MLPSVNEDDPLLQYETRPGSLADQSPMAPSQAGAKRRSSTTSGSADDGRDHGSGMLFIFLFLYEIYYLTSYIQLTLSSPSFFSI